MTVKVSKCPSCHKKHEHEAFVQPSKVIKGKIKIYLICPNTRKAFKAVASVVMVA